VSTANEPTTSTNARANLDEASNRRTISTAIPVLRFGYADVTDSTTALNCAGSVTVSPCSS
jgi:hypothetical protein